MRKSTINIALAAILACRFADPSTASDASTPPPSDTVLTGATVIDVGDRGRRVADIADAVLLIRDGRVAALGKRGAIDIPPGARVINVSGKFIVPGLIDGFCGMQSQAEADAQLYYGVTTIAASGDDRRGTVFLAADPSPSVYMLDSAGSTDDWSLLRSEPGWRERLADDGAPHELDISQTQLQLHATAQRGTRGVWVGHNITQQNARALLAGARALHLVTYGEFIRTPYAVAIDSGVSVLLHMSRLELGLAPPAMLVDENAAYAFIDTVDPLSPAVAAYGDSIAAHHVALMPTFSLFSDLLPQEGQAPKAGAGRDALASRVAHTFAIDKALIARGALVLAASGSTWQSALPGSSMHTELKILVAAGLTPRAALASATSNYAQQFGWNEIGGVIPGRRADLLVLDRDPTQDIHAIDAIDAVYLAGRKIDRAVLIKPSATR